ncbi:MAG TPA: VOC family protein [Nocardioides sp.]|nr:VOC family protein [Nocardioides sp.]
MQRLGSGGDRIHLDLHVDDPRAAADRASGLGAREVADQGHVLMVSPGGFAFCFVPGGPGERPRPWTRAGGHAALLDQVCLDVPHERFDAECNFWSALTGWDQARSRVSDDFRPLHRPPDQPLRILLQRLGADDPGGVTRAHLDWACTDRAAETERHVGLGATVEAVRDRWTVFADPTGRRYCLTDRDPTSGLLPVPPRTVAP